MNILIVEDTSAERQKAQAAVIAAGHTPILAENLAEAIARFPECEGIITDLHFSPYPNEGFEKSIREYGYAENPPPAGLLVVITAIGTGKPVVICTDGHAVGGHHGKTLSWLYDGYMAVCQHTLRAAIGETPCHFEEGPNLFG